jgi:hypothetical protein
LKLILKFLFKVSFSFLRSLLIIYIYTHTHITIKDIFIF